MIEYAEIQNNEVEALKAIYMEDFVDCPQNSAWNKSPSPKFRIKLRPSSQYESSSIALELLVTMMATYPKTRPTISVESSNALHPKHLDVIRKSIELTIEHLLGGEMIFEITSNIQDLLDEYARIHEEAPSLEEARLKRLQMVEEERVRETERKRKEVEDKVLQQEKQLEQLVLEELDHESNSAEEDELPVVLLPESQAGVYTFDRPIIARRHNGSPVRFQQVLAGIPTDISFFGTSQIVKPVVSSAVNIDDDILFTLTEVTLTEPFWDTTEGRKAVKELERELELVRKFRHPNVLSLYEFQITRRGDSPGWKIWLLSQYANMGTVSDFLDTIGTASIKIARSWSIQLLEALESLHKSGIVHKALCLENIVLHRNRDTGECSLLLSHPSYLFRLIELNNMSPFSSLTEPVTLEQRWQPPEYSAAERLIPTRKTDIWQFGTCLVQVIAGKATINVAGASAFVRSQKWPASLTAFLTSTFEANPKNRPSAFELLTTQFLRSSDDMALSTPRSQSFSQPRTRSDLESHFGTYSRYTNDFDEAVVLGRGGFGQVVKARNKLDGRIYAVKKIQATSATLSFILQEVVLLSRLNHSNVVRYYTVWLEDNPDTPRISEIQDRSDDVIQSGSSVEPSGYSTPKFNASLSDLDLMSASQDIMSNSFIQFGDSTNELAVESCDEERADEAAELSIVSQNVTRRSPIIDKETTRGPLERAPVPALKSTLYIQMEYCENHTLADLINDGLYKQPIEYWRLFRQTVEALAYIHQEGIIHRDLKPKNIFIDENLNIKIGDFGLARSVIQSSSQTVSREPSFTDGDDLTTGIGTSLYIAIELESKGRKGSYNEKVDIYSLGIIFFEMVYHMRTEMERINTLRRLRLPSIEMPPTFLSKRYDSEREIVHSLLNPDPTKRPSAAELLKSGKIPSTTEDLTIKDALNTLMGSQSKSIKQVCNAIFQQPLISAQQVLYDRTNVPGRSSLIERSSQDLKYILLKNTVEEKLRRVFELHGAVEDSSFRSKIFPKSAIYKLPTVVELLDPTGNVLQLPHDLTLPFARRLAEQTPAYSKSFIFAPVFRTEAPQSGHHPLVCNEADFDIVNVDSPGSPLFSDAETIKVMVAAILSSGCLNEKTIAVHVNHSDMLNTVLEYCGFTLPQHHAALSLLGELGVGPANRAVRRDILSRSTISAASLDLLEQMAFKESLDKAEATLCALLGDTEKTKRGFLYLRRVVSLAKRYGVTVPIYFAPLSNYQPKFFEGGIMFQVVVSDDSGSQILAAGGRYDRLIQSFRQSVLDAEKPVPQAVGFNLAVDSLVERAIAGNLALPAGEKVARARCNVLVTSFNDANIEGMCIEILRLLWQNDISSDLVRNVRSSEELKKIAERDNIHFIIVVKQLHAMSMSSKSFKPLRVRNVPLHTDMDMTVGELVPFLLTETAPDRSRGARMSASTPDLDTQSKEDYGGPSIDIPKESNKVLVLSESGRVKGGKKNRWLIEERCHAALQEHLSELSSAPIVTLDLRDDVMQAITSVSPYSHEDWKRRVAGLAPNQKAYIMTIQAKLATEAARSSLVVLYSTKSDGIYIYNTGSWSA